MKLMRKIVLILLLLLAAYTTHVGAEVGDLLMSTGYTSLDVGESWNLEESYVLTINQISKDGTKIWLSLSKYNSEVDSEVLSKGETYVYEVEIGSKEYNILRATVGEIDKESRTVRLDSVRQYSDENVAVTSAPTPTTTQQDSSSEIITSSAINSFFAPPETQPSGLAYDGTYLWLSSYKKNGGIYKLNPDDGSVSRKYMPPVSQYDSYGGITYDGSHLWQVDRYEGKLYKLNPSDCSIISSISGPDKSPSGLTWDGKYLWTYGYPSYKIYKINPSDGTIIATFDPPSGIEQNAGLAFDGTYMWISGGSYLYELNGYIYKLNPSDCSVISAYEAPCSRPISLTWDGKYLWCASFDSGKIYQLEVGESALAGTTASSTVKLIFPLNGAAMDNGRTDCQDDEVWDFDWLDVENASRYQLYVKKDTSENPVIDTMTTRSSYHYVSPGSYIVDRNCYGWTWKVRAQVNGQWGEWSETRNFQVEKVNTDRPSQTVTQPTLAPTPVRTPSTTLYAAPVATSATSTSQQNKTSKIFPALIILGLLCVVGYVLVRSSPEGGWTVKLIDAVKYKYYGSDSEGMQMRNRNAILLPDKKFGGALGGAIAGATIFVFLCIMDPGSIIETIIAVIIGVIVGAVCGASAAMVEKVEEDYVIRVVKKGGTTGAVVGGVGIGVFGGAFFAVTEGDLFGGIVVSIVSGTIGAIVGAIAGAITGPVGNWTGGVTNKMREKQLRHLRTVPGLFDTAKKLSTEANTLFKQGNYTKALQTYNDALDNFNKASKGALATGDVNLVGIIANNTTTIEENVVLCKNSIGTEIIEGANNKFEIGNFDRAIQSYQEALRYLKDPDLVAKANDSIKICYREIDIGKVEEYSNRAISMLNEATSITESFKAREILKQADDEIEKAVTIAMERKFTEELQQLNTISRNIRTQRSVVDDRMADGGEVFSGEDYDLGTVTGKTGPSVPTPSVMSSAKQPTSIEIKRDPNILPNKDLGFSISVKNISKYTINDVDVLLQYDRSLFSVKDNEVEHLGNITKNGEKTADYILTALVACVHYSEINAIISYKDASNVHHTDQMRPKEVSCISPHLAENPMTEEQFSKLYENHSCHVKGTVFKGISSESITNYIVDLSKGKRYVVKNSFVNGTHIIYLASTAKDKTYYLLTIIIRDEDDLTHVGLRACSNNEVGINNFIGEILSSLRNYINNIQSAKEVEKITINKSIQIIESTIHGGVSLEGDAYGRNESINVRSRR